MKTRDELRREWLDALRSGNYQQCQRQLRHNDGYCCLGVLCDISEMGSWKNPDNDKEFEFAYADGLTESAILPKPIRELVGISDTLQHSLICKNDNNEADFNTIANFLEKHFNTEKE
jgi:hypothetical protein